VSKTRTSRLNLRFENKDNMKNICKMHEHWDKKVSVYGTEIAFDYKVMVNCEIQFFETSKGCMYR